MAFITIGCCILLLVLLIVWIKVEPFIAFLIASITAGIFLGIPLENIAGAVQKGIGDLLGSLVIIITLGAMLGKIVADSGAAQRIAAFLMKAFGKKHLHWAIAVTGFVVGIPLFFNVGFVLLVPLVFTVTYQYRIPAMTVGIPMLAALSVTHGLLPPHPAPVALVSQFNANMGLTLVYGMVLSVPMIIIAGPMFGKVAFLKNMKVRPMEVFRGTHKDESELPGLANSLISSLLPVFLLISLSLLSMKFDDSHPGFAFLQFIGNPSVVMLISLLWATYSLGIRKGKSVKPIMEGYTLAVKDIALVLLIIAGAGAFKEVLVESGISEEIGTMLQSWDVNPLLLGWVIAAIIRISVGSATVAALTAAGIVAPLLASGDTNPNLMVLSVGAGSLILSHVNDGGFWLVKEYFNLSVRQTLQSWTLLETLVAVLGLIGVLALDFIL